MDRRIRQNELAHSPKWTYIRAGWRLSRPKAPWARGLGTPGAHAAKAPSPLEYIHMYGVSCMRWSILANAPVHFGECANPFYRMRLSILANVSRYSGIQVFRYPGYNTITITTTITTTELWWHGGVRKDHFQQSDTTHSGTGEKEALNINVVGKK